MKIFYSISLIFTLFTFVMSNRLNVLNGELAICSTDPLTGFKNNFNYWLLCFNFTHKIKDIQGMAFVILMNMITVLILFVQLLQRSFLNIQNPKVTIYLQHTLHIFQDWNKVTIGVYVWADGLKPTIME